MKGTIFILTLTGMLGILSYTLIYSSKSTTSSTEKIPSAHKVAVFPKPRETLQIEEKKTTTIDQEKAKSQELATISEWGGSDSIATIVGLPKEEIKTLAFNYQLLDQISVGDIIKIPISEDFIEEYYITQIIEDNEVRSLIGHLSKFSPAYYFGLVYDNFGAASGTLITIDNNFTIQTINGNTLFHRSIEKKGTF